MATVKAIVRTTQKGAANVKIRFRLSAGRGVQLFHKSEITVNADLWDSEKECIKAKKICPNEYRLNINKQVNDRKALILALYEEHSTVIENSSDFEALIDDTLHPKAKKVEGFFPTFELFLTKRELSKSEWKNYKTLERLLYRYQSYLQIIDSPKFTLSLELDKEQLQDFFDYARNEYSLIEESPNIFAGLLVQYPIITNIERRTAQIEERGNNTMLKIKQRLKTFFNWAASEGITTNRPFDGLTLGSPLYGTPYYITLEERDKIAEYDLSEHPKLAIQRDIFVFQCYIGCRVGDLLKLTNANIVGDTLEYMPHKTMKKQPNKITVPLHKNAVELLKRYQQPADNSPIFPFITAQKYNEAIKQIFTRCGVCRNVVIINPKTSEPENVPINTIASSHLARRTFVGNLYKQVKDPNLIGKLSGHTEGSRAFARYRDIDEEIKKELINLL